MRSPSESIGGADCVRSTFGTLADGRSVEAIDLRNSHGITARIIALGASVQSLSVPDRDGSAADIVLGCAHVSDYWSKPQYFGATLGRFANRVAKGRFVLDGKIHQLATNDGANSLHGGTRGFDRRLWTVEAVTRGTAAGVKMSYISSDGDEGYPGTLMSTAAYELNQADELSIEYRATTDRPTIVNLSNHSFFNLAGEASASGILDQVLILAAEEYTPVDSALIPTGEFRAVAGTAFDFRTPKPIGRDIRDNDVQIAHGRGYDHNWVVSRRAVQSPRFVARVADPASGRVLEMLSNQPGIQFYSGNFLDGTVIGKSGRAYRRGDAFALEPQRFPDAPNQPAFGSARLDPGDTYVNRIVYRFSVIGH